MNLQMMGFPDSSAGKEYACNDGDLGLIPELGRSPGEGNGYLLQYSGLENPMVFIGHGGHKESDMTERLSLHFTTDDYQGYRTHKGTFHPISQLSSLPTFAII